MPELAHPTFSQDLHVLVYVAVRYLFYHPPVGAPNYLLIEIAPGIFAAVASRFRDLVVVEAKE